MRRAVVDALELGPGMRVLELGSGPGRLAVEIRKTHPEIRLEAVDIDRTMVVRGRRNAARAGVDIEFRQGDMTCPELLGEGRGRYDRVVSTMVFHHLAPKEKAAALRVCRAALGPCGSFVLVDFGIPADSLQWALFSFIQRPLDGFTNTTPHRDGRFQLAVHEVFPHARSKAVWRTAAGTLEMLHCPLNPR
jgi:cyclopropane fatty-acyl-phospholipid synthase-like methyltransferase